MTPRPAYHLRRQDRAVTEPAEVDGILRAGRFATIAFARDDEPYVVTLSYGYEPSADGAPEGGTLYFHTAHKGQKLEFMAANPSVCATVVLDDGYQAGQCAHEYRSIVVRGTLREVGDRAGRLRGMEVLIGHLEGAEGVEPMFARHDLAGDAVYRRMAVLRLDIETVSAKKGS